MEDVKDTIYLTGGPFDGQTKEVTPGAIKQKMVHFWKDDARTESVVYAFSEKQNAWVWIDLDLVPEVLPTSGRIVWYSPTARQHDLILENYTDDDPDVYLPAIVVKAFKDGSVNLKVYAQHDLYVEGATYDKRGSVGTWQWPVITPQTRNLVDFLK